MALPMVPHRGNSGTPSGMGSTFDPNECAAPLPHSLARLAVV